MMIRPIIPGLKGGASPSRITSTKVSQILS